MKLAVVLTGLFGIFVLACSSAAPAEPTFNIDATVEARAKELVAAQATDKPIATEVATPLPTLQPTMTPTPSPFTGVWEYTELADPLTDKTDLFLKAAAASVEGSYGDPISINIGCLSTGTIVSIHWNTFIGLDSTQVIQRWDSTDAFFADWDLNSDGTATYVMGWGADWFVGDMLKSNQLIARVSPYSGPLLTATFDLRGLDEAIKPLYEACPDLQPALPTPVPPPVPTSTPTPEPAEFITKWGTNGTGDGQFENPTSIAVASGGSVYVADNINDRIQKFTSEGLFVIKWGTEGTGDGEFNSPNGVAVASDGSVYVADTGNRRIQKFTSEGVFVSEWGTEGTGDGEFNSPNGVAVASDGSVYVADTGNRRIQKFTSEGVFVIKWGVGAGVGEYGDPYGIAIASDGSVYVADKINRRIQKFTSEGLFVSKWGSTGKGNGEFYNLYGVAVATNGNVYVADTFNNRIQKFSVVPTATPQLKPTAIPTIYPTDTPMPVPTPTSIPTSAPRPIPTAPPPTMKPPTPTPRPTATPKPSRAISFSDGTWVVGSDILHGTYRSSRTGGGCYWERLSSFSGGFGDIIANEITDELSLVEISSTDAGFSTRDCGTWKKATTRITSSLTSPFGDGAFIVGLDIASGTWSSPGGGSCYWERLSGFSGELRHIEANDVGGFNNIVTIQSTDIGFSSSDCGSWTKQ